MTDFRELCQQFVDAVGQLTSHGDSVRGPGHRLILTVDVGHLETGGKEQSTASCIIELRDTLSLTREALSALEQRVGEAAEEFNEHAHSNCFCLDAICRRLDKLEAAAAPRGEAPPPAGSLGEREQWLEDCVRRQYDRSGAPFPDGHPRQPMENPPEPAGSLVEVVALALAQVADPVQNNVEAMELAVKALQEGADG
jgi:hypothetical protein